MAITLRDSASGATQVTATTGTVTLTGLDVLPGALIVVANSSERGALADVRTPTCSDGTFTLLGAGASDTTNGDFLKLFYLQVATTTSTNFSVACTNVTAASAQKSIYATALVFTGHNGVGDSNYTGSEVAPSVTPTNSTDWLVCAFGHENAVATPTVTGMTRQQVVADGSSLGSASIFTEALASSAATGTRTVSATPSVSGSLIVKNAVAPVKATQFLPFFVQ